MLDKLRNIRCRLDHPTPAGTRMWLYVNVKKRNAPELDIDPNPKRMIRRNASEYYLNDVKVNPSSSPNKFLVLRVLLIFPTGHSFFLDGASPDHV